MSSFLKSVVSEHKKSAHHDSFLSDERVAEGRFPIRYILKEVPDARWLLVIFSAFAANDHPIQHPYNFTNALDMVPANKLYIQDSCGRHGVYYLCDHLDFGVEETVSKLILDVQARVACTNEYTISLGSSKGGSAAAYFALKHGFRYGFPMVPQFRIGTFISYGASKRETLEDMLGAQATAADIARLDTVFDRHLENNTATQLRVLTSVNDEQYSQQIEPMLAALERHGHTIVWENGIKGHDQAAGYNADFIHGQLTKCMFGIEAAWDDQFVVFRRAPHLCSEYTAEYRWKDKHGNSRTVQLGESEVMIPIGGMYPGELCLFDQETIVYRRVYCPWITEAFSAICKQTKETWEVEFSNHDTDVPEILRSFAICDDKNKVVYSQDYTGERVFSVSRNKLAGRKLLCNWKYKDWVVSRTEKIALLPVDSSLFRYEMSVENGELLFETVPQEDETDIQYAFYLKCGGEVIHKQMYSANRKFTYHLERSGNYSVQYFMKRGDSRAFLESDRIDYARKE